jgi:PAS domain S-box-containing protein
MMAGNLPLSSRIATMRPMNEWQPPAGPFMLCLLATAVWLAAFFCPALPARGHDSEEIKIGVLANKGREECLQKWGPTAEYLTGKIPDHAFTIVPLDFNELLPAVAGEKVDFILVNPANYVELENLHRVSCIVTLKALLHDTVATVFAGTIFTKAGRTDLAALADLKGKRFMAVDEKSFGGWHVSWFELLAQGIDPYKDFKEMRFGGTHDAVVYAVRDGLVDAGCVRSDTLEGMALAGKIALADFKVFEHAAMDKAYYPFLHSTVSYPEWPFAKLESVPIGLAEQVAMALLAMRQGDPAARAANIAGWTIPLNYQPVHECLKRLKLSPYEHFGETTFAEAVRQHLWETSLAALFLLFLLFSGIRGRQLNSSLQQAKAEVDARLEDEKKAQRRLQESEERVKVILASMQTGIIIIDPASHIIVYVNAEAAKMVGLPREGMVGRKCFGLICPKREGECPVTDRHEIVKNAKRVLFTATGEEMAVLKTVSFIRIGGKDYIMDSFQDISKLQKAEEELARRSESLAVRVKMLHCLNEISRVMESREYNVEQMLQEIIRRIPLAWQHPDRTCVRILLENREYASENFSESPWKLSRPIKLAQAPAGEIEVHCLRDEADCAGEPFLAEERELIETIASQVSYSIERKKAEEGRRFFRHLIDQATDGFFVVDPMNSRILEVNARACRLLGYEREEIINMRLAQITTLTPDDRLFAEANGDDEAEAMVLESAFRRKDGVPFPVEAHLKIISQESRKYLVVLAHDITFRKTAEKEKKAMETQLLQSEKMAAVGQLSAGVAHEINNPTGFVSSNLSTLGNYVRDLKRLTTEYRKLSADLAEQLDPAEYPLISSQIADLGRLEKKIDIDFVLRDIEDLVAESREGTERIKKIVSDLKGFSHPGEDRQQMADINAGIESTLNVVWNEIKYKAQVSKELGDIPPVRCYPQQINQVFMNILVNAAQAIPEKGEIVIRTCLEGDLVKITISDTGTGIKPENLPRIFEPFFTTKEVGKGTGLGLNVAYNIVKKHKGSIEARSSVGAGTTFIIRLPQNADVVSDNPPV